MDIALLSVLKLFLFSVMTQGLTLDQLCPAPLHQAAHAPWAKKSPSVAIIFQHILHELINNSFVSSPNTKVTKCIKPRLWISLSYSYIHEAIMLIYTNANYFWKMIGNDNIYEILICLLHILSYTNVCNALSVFIFQVHIQRNHIWTSVSR